MNNTIVQGPTGINSVTTWMDYTLPDNIQNLTVTGDGLYAVGNALDNLIQVGDTNDMQLYGAGGNNVLVGGTGSDTFIVDSTTGSNAIYGWHAGDTLRLLGSNLTSFAQVQAAMTQVGPDVEFDTGANHVVVRNATLSEFTASDFDLSLNKALLGAMTFDDEFNTLSLRSASNPTGTWTPNYWYGGIGAYTLTGNGELQLYTAPGFTGSGSTDLGLNPFSINNGVLDIHAQAVSAADSASMWGYGYSSGVITTKDSFAQTYGYFEMRAELPANVSGAWPAFWLVPADGSWPPELDVMETLSGTPNLDYTTVHTDETGSPAAIGSANLVPDAGGYHTYGVLWTATELVWYLDGQEVFATATPADMHQPMYMIANLAVGGWAGTPNFTSADMDIDYIHAYALADGSTTYTSEVVSDTASTAGTSSTTDTSSTTATDTSIQTTDPTTTASTTAASTTTASTTTASTTANSTTSTSSSTTSTNTASTSTASTGASTISSSTSTTSTSSNASHGVSVSSAVYTAPDAINDITLTGSGQTVTGNNAGDIFNSNNTGNHLIGGTGNDTFILGRGGDVVTGGGGADTFVFNETPWAAGQITDFNPSLDTLNLTGLLAASGYTGSNPIADGYLKIVSDGHGSTQIWSNLDPVSAGLGWWLVTTLDGVSPSALTLTGGVIAPVAAVSPIVSTAAASFTAPAGVTDITLTGSGQTVTGNNAGDTFHSNNSGNHLIGGTGNDTFILGRGGDVATGGGGNDTFVFNETPWAAGHITDFDPTHDIVDLTGLLAASGYTGSNPIADGYLKIVSDGHGSTQIWSDLDPVSAGLGWWLVTTLDGVAPSSVALEGDKVGALPVTTAASTYVATGGVLDIALTGSGQTVTGNDHGDTFHSNNSGNHLIGGTGADTFILGRGGDIVTGGGGNDTFVFNETPWASGQITDFTPGQDVIDLTGLLAASGYTGSNAIADNYLKIVDDGHGDTQLWSNLNPVSAGLGWWEITTLDGVAASQVHLYGAFITG